MANYDLLEFLSDEGMAVGVSFFLIWWVTSEVSKVLNNIAEKLAEHDVRAEHIDTKLDRIGCRVVEIGDDINDIHQNVVK
jgi:hypothetical protein